jgi:hypothetical protein
VLPSGVLAFALAGLSSNSGKVLILSPAAPLKRFPLCRIRDGGIISGYKEGA